VIRCEYCELVLHEWFVTDQSDDHSPEVKDEDCVKSLMGLDDNLAICSHVICSLSLVKCDLR
jgi:hypothetical protein